MVEITFADEFDEKLQTVLTRCGFRRRLYFLISVSGKPTQVSKVGSFAPINHKKVS